MERAPIICIDSNLTLEAIEATLLLAKRLGKPGEVDRNLINSELTNLNKYLTQSTVFYEPTDMSIAGKPFELERKCYEQIKFISPNLYELRKIAETLKLSPAIKSDLKVENVRTADEEQKVFTEIVELCDKLQEHIDNIVVTAGSFGVFVQRSRESESAFFTESLSYIEDNGSRKSCRHYPGKPIDEIVNASGAGDAFCAGFVTGMLQQKSEAICVSVGFEAAISTLMSERAVPQTFFAPDHRCWQSPAKFTCLNHF